MFTAGLVQLTNTLGGSDGTVLGQDQNTIVSSDTLTNQTTNNNTPVASDGTLSQVVAQPKTVNKFPTWIIILIALLGSVVVFSLLGAILHRLGKRNRNARAKRWVKQNDMVNLGR